MTTNRGRVRPALRLVRDALRARRREALKLLGWSLLEAIPAFLTGRIVQLAVDQGFLQHRVLAGFGWLAVLAVSVVVGAIAAGKVFRGLGAVIEPMRDDLARRVVAGSIARSARLGVAADRAGVARLTEQVEITREACASVLMVTQGFIVAAIGAGAGLLTLAPAALLLVVPPVLLGLAIFAVTLPRMADRQLEAILADERAADSVAAVAAGMRDVVSCGAESPAQRLVTRHIDAQAEATRRLARLTAVRTLAVATGGLLPAILILAFGGWLRGGGATTGAILGALTYVLQGVQPALQQLVRNLGANGAWLVSAVTRIADATPDVEGSPSRAGATTSDTDVTGERAADAPVSLRDLSFAYATNAAPIVQRLSLTVLPGDHLAIVGPSGAGKSTLAALIAGLLQPDSGAVRIGSMDAVDARHRAASMRSLIPQEAYVFSGTLVENITYLNDAASSADIERAVSIFVPHLVARLGGVETTIDPSTLSAGERQLITLARAYLSTAPVIVLDEATCHLDPHTEARAEAAFAELGRSLIVIAHRMSSAVRAHRVLLLDGGDAVLGTHDELLAESELYRSLVGHWSAVA